MSIRKASDSVAADSPDNNNEGDLFVFPTQPSNKSAAEIEAAEAEITHSLRDVRYIVREYPTEVVVQKYLSGLKRDERNLRTRVSAGANMA